ncbi:hypothetical protein PV458_02540 [Streptomyces sp. MN03-5084-2B]|nr:hypothetical protein [Streptomyces sp. MN03-5084-2B]
MRITIHIDEDGASVTTSAATPGEAADTGSTAPPADLAARAARLGAVSAGPAPTSAPAADAPGLGHKPDTSPGSPADVSAGPAPAAGRPSTKQELS